MTKRLNITLPEQTVRLIDRVAGKGHRSSLIDTAVRRYLQREARTNLRRRLVESYKYNADFDLQLTEEWFPIEEEIWRQENH